MFYLLRIARGDSRVLLSVIKHSIQRYLTVIITFEGATIQLQ